MSVNQHTMGHFHSWVYSGSSFFKYSELILPIYMDGRAETKTTVSHPLVQLHSNITAPPPLYNSCMSSFLCQNLLLPFLFTAELFIGPFSAQTSYSWKWFK